MLLAKPDFVKLCKHTQNFPLKIHSLCLATNFSWFTSHSIQYLIQFFIYIVNSYRERTLFWSADKMSQAASTETSSRRRRANSRQRNKIFDEWDRLSQPFNEDELRLALSEATECFKIQQQLYESYLEAVQDDQYDTEVDLVQDKHTVVRMKLFQMGKAIAKFELQKVDENVTMNTSFGDAKQHQPHVAKLPQIQLPKFYGKFTDWIAFIDQFDTAVHLNTKLLNSKRLVYLKSGLSGPPEKLIKSLSSTDSNYETARNLLEQRYKNDRIILRTLQASAVDFKPVRGESKYQLRLLHSTFNEVTQSIHSLGRQVDNDMWHYLLFTKLDVDSQKAWELKNEGTECLKFDKLMTFLDNWVRSMEMLNDPIPPKQLHITGWDERSRQGFKQPCVVT